MSVDTKCVPGRRTLHFQSFDEMLADAERLVASSDTKTLGNWPLSQLLMHLAGAVHSSIDGLDTRLPWYVRLLGRFIKRRVMRQGIKPGIQLPKAVVDKAFPKAESPQRALDELRAAIARTRREPMTARHPVFGQLTHEEWTQFHLRHAELHLSFAVPSAYASKPAHHRLRLPSVV